MLKFLIDECLSLDLVDVVSRKAPTLYGWAKQDGKTGS